MTAHALTRCAGQPWRVAATVADDRRVHVSDLLALASMDACHTSDPVIVVNERTRVVYVNERRPAHDITRALVAAGLPHTMPHRVVECWV